MIGEWHGASHLICNCLLYCLTSYPYFYPSNTTTCIRKKDKTIDSRIRYAPISRGQSTKRNPCDPRPSRHQDHVWCPPPQLSWAFQWYQTRNPIHRNKRTYIHHRSSYAKQDKKETTNMENTKNIHKYLWMVYFCDNGICI